MKHKKKRIHTGYGTDPQIYEYMVHESELKQEKSLTDNVLLDEEIYIEI